MASAGARACNGRLEAVHAVVGEGQSLPEAEHYLAIA